MANPVYLALRITGDGQHEVLGLCVADDEGAKVWLAIVTELRNRRLQDILIAMVDGLKGFPEAITARLVQGELRRTHMRSLGTT